MKKGLLILMVAILWGVTGCGKKEEPAPRAFNEDYIAYLKINPSFKLKYTRACLEYSDGSKKCEGPVVNAVEPVNDDAKELLKDVDILTETTNLSKVINKICEKAEEKGIDVSTVSVESDWDGIKTYLTAEKNASEPTTTAPTTEPAEGNEPVEEPTEVKTYSFEVNVATEEVITNTIETDVKEEEDRKVAEAEAKAKEEAEKKAKEEAAAKEKAEKTIYLSDNVTYSHTGRAFCCEGCITDSVIRTFKNATGYSVTNADHDRIDFKKITKLSGKYNESKFKGSDLTSKLTALGAEECGGLGGEDEPLTKSICKEYNLLCE